jgi:hypothetical protein
VRGRVGKDSPPQPHASRLPVIFSPSIAPGAVSCKPSPSSLTPQTVWLGSPAGFLHCMTDKSRESCTPGPATTTLGYSAPSQSMLLASTWKVSWLPTQAMCCTHALTVFQEFEGISDSKKDLSCMALVCDNQKAWINPRLRLPSPKPERDLCGTHIILQHVLFFITYKFKTVISTRYGGTHF